MNGSTHKQEVESLLNEESEQLHLAPIDMWIELALYTDERQVRDLHAIVVSAVKRLKWELENVPDRWVHVREIKIHQLSFWTALQDKLFSLFVALDDIPF